MTTDKDKINRALGKLYGAMYDMRHVSYKDYLFTSVLDYLQNIQEICRWLNLACTVSTGQVSGKYSRTCDIFIADFPDDIEQTLQADTYFNIIHVFFGFDPPRETAFKDFCIACQLYHYVKKNKMITEEEARRLYEEK